MRFACVPFGSLSDGRGVGAVRQCSEDHLLPSFRRFSMSKSHRHWPDAALGRNAGKPRELKRRRQREAMVRPGAPAPCFPEPEAPLWKPLG